MRACTSWYTYEQLVEAQSSLGFMLLKLVLGGDDHDFDESLRIAKIGDADGCA